MLLLGVGGAMREAVEAELALTGLRLRHYAALGHLAGTPGISYSELARRGRITVQSLQDTLAQLERLGAVERRSPPGRGQRADLHVTAAGQVLLGRARQAVHTAEDRLFAPLAPQDREQFTGLLVRLLQTRPDTGG